MLTLFSISGAYAHEALPTVESVDQARYLGKWYEIARLPNSFEKNCTGVTAEYSLKKNGDIRVENRCYKYTLDGKEKISVGTAKNVEGSNGAKLRVSFFWPFAGDYWILKLGANYEYVLVGEPSRKYLWVLSRTPRMDLLAFVDLLVYADQLGFDTKKMVETAQRD